MAGARGRTLAGSVGVSVVALVLVTSACIAVAGVVIAERIVTSGAGERVASIAATVAASPVTVEALAAGESTEEVRDLAERVQASAEVSFVVVMDLTGTRLTHPNPTRIGGTYLGTIAPLADGERVTETFQGTLGPSVRSAVPVLGDDGEPVGAVAVGIPVEHVGLLVASSRGPFLAAVAAAVVVALAASAAVVRHLRRRTFGLSADGLARQHAHHLASLHAVREGLVVVDGVGRVSVCNDEARRLLDLAEDVVGGPAADLPVPERLRQLLVSGREVTDELHATEQHLLVVNQVPLRRLSDDPAADVAGTVLTMRDRTELIALSDELGAVRSLTASLRAQAHEADNRLQTVLSLLELGRPEDAIRLATARLETTQRLVDRLVGRVDEPELVALLLGKTREAEEHGAELEVEVPRPIAPTGLEPLDLLTVVGNLVDNAFDAVAEARGRREVTVRLTTLDRHLEVEVADRGPGFSDEARDRAFEPGWSTREASGRGALGRGTGLALVRRTVRRLDGEVLIDDRDDGPGAVVTVRLPLAPRTAPGPRAADLGTVSP